MLRNRPDGPVARAEAEADRRRVELVDRAIERFLRRPELVPIRIGGEDVAALVAEFGPLSSITRGGLAVVTREGPAGPMAEVLRHVDLDLVAHRDYERRILGAARRLVCGHEVPIGELAELVGMVADCAGGEATEAECRRVLEDLGRMGNLLDPPETVEDFALLIRSLLDERDRAGGRVESAPGRLPILGAEDLELKSGPEIL